ncbi:MAG TPA: hypothetical protein VLL54_07080 [Pyrinomonadaceae bacterium]|nr:hypothetical protein [Pyrinomonadaceae bacterium]
MKTVGRTKSRLGMNAALALVLIAMSSTTMPAQSHVKKSNRSAVICGDPQVACKTTVDFEANDLQFRVPKNVVILDTVPFYAIMLRSIDVDPNNCNTFIPETDRLAAQTLFPDHKVFTSRCAEPGTLFYEDITKSKTVYLTDKHNFMAVYAGATLSQAKALLLKVKASGNYPGANIRRLRTGFNGT